jgi:hypothetical protein
MTFLSFFVLGVLRTDKAEALLELHKTAEEFLRDEEFSANSRIKHAFRLSLFYSPP